MNALKQNEMQMHGSKTWIHSPWTLEAQGQQQPCRLIWVFEWYSSNIDRTEMSQLKRTVV